jgi:hypothetical protein
METDLGFFLSLPENEMRTNQRGLVRFSQL